jgi:hypothetical protein
MSARPRAEPAALAHGATASKPCQLASQHLALAARPCQEVKPGRLPTSCGAKWLGHCPLGYTSSRACSEAPAASARGGLAGSRKVEQLLAAPSPACCAAPAAPPGDAASRTARSAGTAAAAGGRTTCSRRQERGQARLQQRAADHC